MKAATLFLAFILSLSLNAQKAAPIFEKDGNMVKATYFYENGQIAQVGHFLNGKLEGEWKMFTPEGKKLAIGEYSQGKKSGKWFFWKEGELSEVDYLDNRIANVTEWNDRRLTQY